MQVVNVAEVPGSPDEDEVTEVLNSEEVKCVLVTLQSCCLCFLAACGKYQNVINLFFVNFSQDEVSEELGTRKSVCVRSGCNNLAVDSKDWDKEYCSNECVATHCRYVHAPGHMLYIQSDQF